MSDLAARRDRRLQNELIQDEIREGMEVRVTAHAHGRAHQRHVAIGDHAGTVAITRRDEYSGAQTVHTVYARSHKAEVPIPAAAVAYARVLDTEGGWVCVRRRFPGVRLVVELPLKEDQRRGLAMARAAVIPGSGPKVVLKGDTESAVEKAAAFISGILHCDVSDELFVIVPSHLRNRVSPGSPRVAALHDAFPDCLATIGTMKNTTVIRVRGPVPTVRVAALAAACVVNATALRMAHPTMSDLHECAERVMSDVHAAAEAGHVSIIDMLITKAMDVTNTFLHPYQARQERSKRVYACLGGRTLSQYIEAKEGR